MNPSLHPATNTHGSLSLSAARVDLGEGFRGSQFHTKPTLTCLLIPTLRKVRSLKFKLLLTGTRLAQCWSRLADSTP